MLRPKITALAALCACLALLGCAGGDDTAEDPSAPYIGPAPATVTTELDGVQTTWKAPATCQEVAELRDFLATATPGPLVELMRRGTEDAAARLGCDKP